jgi:hypothetical protein
MEHLYSLELLFRTTRSIDPSLLSYLKPYSASEMTACPLSRVFFYGNYFLKSAKQVIDPESVDGKYEYLILKNKPRLGWLRGEGIL